MPLIPLIVAARQARDLLQLARKALEHYRALPAEEQHRLKDEADRLKRLSVELAAVSARSVGGRTAPAEGVAPRDAKVVAGELRVALATFSSSTAREAEVVAKGESRKMRYAAKAAGFGARRLGGGEAARSDGAPAARIESGSMFGSKKKPKPPPVELNPRVAAVIAREPPRVQDQLRGANSEDGLINEMVDRLAPDDQIAALCMGAPGVFGVSGPGYGVFVLTDRELLWRNRFGQTLDITLADVQQIHTTMVSQHCVYMEVVTQGGHQDALAFSQSEHSSGRNLSEALDAAARSARTSRAAPAPEPAPAAAPAASSAGSVADELEKLDGLRRRGILTDAEFDAQKRALLAG